MTSFAETKMLEHVMSGEDAQAQALVEESTSFELGELHKHLCTLLDLVNEARDSKATAVSVINGRSSR